MRFYKNNKKISNEITIGQAFKKKGLNKATLEISDAIKINFCQKKDLWLSYDPKQTKLIEDIRESLKWEEIRSLNLNDNLDFNNYTDLLTFQFNNRLIIENQPLKDLIPYGKYKNL